MALVLDLAHPITEAELRRLSELNPGTSWSVRRKGGFG
jgi:hypothetical protein